MGRFDTIIVDPPLTCSRCGGELEIQTRYVRWRWYMDKPEI
ncbi:MAG: hypothetical protein ACOC2N_03240 [Spirochaetota bacterium]